MLLDKSWAVGLLMIVCILLLIGLLYFLRVHKTSIVEFELAHAPISIFDIYLK